MSEFGSEVIPNYEYPFEGFEVDTIQWMTVNGKMLNDCNRVKIFCFKFWYFLIIKLTDIACLMYSH